MTAAAVIPELGWQPFPGPQRSFLACPLYEALYGGAAGGGKSQALVVDPLDQCNLKHFVGVIFRTSYPELEELIQLSHELYPMAYPGAEWKESKRCWVFPSGARVYFRYLDNDRTLKRYQGQSFSYVAFDELTHFTERQYTYMKSRLRVKCTCCPIKLYIRSTTNPGGPGHSWVFERFIKHAPGGYRTIYDPKTKTERVFIPAKVTDNPVLANSEYMNHLNALGDADRRALKEGDWDAYTGQVFKLVPGIHRWSWQQFRDRTGLDGIPPGWKRYRVMDWGYSKPFAIYWIAVDHKGRGYVYREWYGIRRDGSGDPMPNVGASLTAAHVGEKLVEVEAYHQELRVEGVADSQCWAQGAGDYGGGPDIIEQMNRAVGGGSKLTWAKAKKDRLQGKHALHGRLRYEVDPKTGAVTRWPGLIFIEEECPHALRTIPLLEYDPLKVEDVDSDMEDHAYDAIRYWCMARPWAPPGPKDPKKLLRREVQKTRRKKRPGQGWQSVRAS